MGCRLFLIPIASVTVGSLGGDTAADTMQSDTISNIILGDDEQGTDYDFSEIPDADPNGFVFIDSNDNGIMDPGEEGIPGVLITLEGVDVFGNSVVQTTLTDGSGFYFFDELNAGTYRIVETQPQGFNDGQEQNGNPAFTVSNDAFSDIVLGWGDLFEGYNFGELEQGTTGYPSRLPPLVGGIQPLLSNLIGGLGGNGGPGPIYAGIPINTNADPLTLDSQLPVTGGYSSAIGSPSDDAMSVDCGCGVAEEVPVEVLEGCGEVIIEPTAPACEIVPVEPTCDSMPGVILFEGAMGEIGAMMDDSVTETISDSDPFMEVGEKTTIEEAPQDSQSQTKPPSFLKRIGNWLSSPIDVNQS